MKNPIRVYRVDAFAQDDAPGSPTGVVPNAEDLDVATMLKISRSLEFSHTAFLSTSEEPDCVFAIRFVTPKGELQNCAHATIAAHCFWAHEFGVAPGQPSKQETATGPQEVWTSETEEGVIVRFRQNPVVQAPVDDATRRQLIRALGCSVEELHSDYPVKLASPGSWRFLVPVRTRQDLLDVRPEFTALSSLCRDRNCIGCFVFWLGEIGERCEAHGRMFAPTIGVNEDAVNGNSSGCLGAYLMDLPVAPRRSELRLRVFQGYNSSVPTSVNVEARRVGERLDTFVGGSAKIIGSREVI